MVRLSDRPDITIAVDWDINIKQNQTNSIGNSLSDFSFRYAQLKKS